MLAVSHFKARRIYQLHLRSNSQGKIIAILSFSLCLPTLMLNQQNTERELGCVKTLLERVADILIWTALYVQDNVDVRAYGSYYTSNTTQDVKNVGSRQWTYQTCSEVGWLQTAPQNNSMRSAWEPTFGLKVMSSILSGQALDVPGLIMTIEDEDPWKHTSIIKGSARFKKRVYEIQCDNCTHSVELYTPSEPLKGFKDSQDLNFSNTMIFGLFDKWIGDHWRQIKIVQE